MPPPVERFAAHQGRFWPAGTSGNTYVRESASGFFAYGVANDGAIKFAVSGNAAELVKLGEVVLHETGIAMRRCEPSPTGDIIAPLPCPGPGPTGQGGMPGGGETKQ